MKHEKKYIQHLFIYVHTESPDQLAQLRSLNRIFSFPLQNHLILQNTYTLDSRYLEV